MVKALSDHKDKTKITFLICCNSIGTEKRPLMIIMKSAKPRPFGKKTGEELGVDYPCSLLCGKTTLIVQRIGLRRYAKKRGLKNSVNQRPLAVCKHGPMPLPGNVRLFCFTRGANKGSSHESKLYLILPRNLLCMDGVIEFYYHKQLI